MAKKPSTPAVEEQENEETASESASSQPSSKTTPPPNSNPKNNSDEDEEETDSDNEPPPKTKSLEQTLKSKPQPKPSPATARSGTKRPAENNDTKQSNKKKTTVEEKKKKKEKEPEEDNKKSGDDSKKLFQRVFTDDDDVAILQGLVDFTEKTGTDPCKYLTAFYEFVKKSIHVQVTLDQLKDKVRRLRVRYERRIKSGKTPANSKPVDEKRFELSKKVWGGKVNEAEENGKPAKKEPAAKKARTTKKLVMENDLSLVVSKETRMVESGDGKENTVLSLGLNEMICGEPVVDVLKRGMVLIEESKRGELERRSQKLQVAKLELFVQRSELVKDSASLILDALKSSSSH